jgi:hypothetical protein
LIARGPEDPQRASRAPLSTLLALDVLAFLDELAHTLPALVAELRVALRAELLFSRLAAEP